jgi:hypothetical protein
MLKTTQLRVQNMGGLHPMIENVVGLQKEVLDNNRLLKKADPESSFSAAVHTRCCKLTAATGPRHPVAIGINPL